MLWQAVRAARDIGRVHDIAGVLIRYGFGDLVQRVGMAGALERAGRTLHWKASREHAQLQPAARVCRALEELGPTFIKLGQILATRVDLFPPEWIAEFETLQDAVPAVPYEDIHAQLSEDLGGSPESIFAEFDAEPIAAASLAQVYGARLADGAAVILKVRRPGIRSMVEADLRLLAQLARIAETEVPELGRYRIREVVRQLNLSLRREMDFAAECRSAERVARNFEGHDEIVIPGIHWQWTSERLNVQDRIEGIPGRRIAALEAEGLDRRQLARRGADAVLKMVLEDGFFHADPHPGNVFYLAGNRVAFIDFGMVGRLSNERRYQVARLLEGLVSRDAEIAAEVLLDWGSNDADSGTLRDEIDAFIDHYHGVPLRSLSVGGMLSDLMAILREHSLSLPPDLTLLVKALVTLEGMGRQLDADFDMAGAAKPWVRQSILAYHSPEVMARRGWRSTLGALDLVTSLPKDLRRLLRAARRGHLQVQVDVRALKQFGDRIDRAFSRLTLGIVTAALIVGSSIVMTTTRDATTAGAPLLAVLGFVAAVISGVVVLFSIWRGGKGRG